MLLDSHEIDGGGVANDEASKMDGREVVRRGWETYIFEEIRFIRFHINKN